MSGGLVRSGASAIAALTDGQVSMPALDAQGRLRIAQDYGNNFLTAAIGPVAATSMNPIFPVSPANKLQVLLGMMVTGLGATAASVISVTFGNILGGSMAIPLSIPAGVNTPITPLFFTFGPGIPANGPGSQITMTVPSFGAGNTQAQSWIWGYAL